MSCHCAHLLSFPSTILLFRLLRLCFSAPLITFLPSCDNAFVFIVFPLCLVITFIISFPSAIILRLCFSAPLLLLLPPYDNAVAVVERVPPSQGSALSRERPVKGAPSEGISLSRVIVNRKFCVLYWKLARQSRICCNASVVRSKREPPLQKLIPEPNKVSRRLFREPNAASRRLFEGPTELPGFHSRAEQGFQDVVWDWTIPLKPGARHLPSCPHD
eukprot:15032098-Heterocapsa_arctica.AAC.1